MTEVREQMGSLQALVTGVLAGALVKASGEFLMIDVNVVVDDATGDYLPEIFVRGQQSGERLMISIQEVGRDGP